MIDNPDFMFISYNGLSEQIKFANNNLKSWSALINSMIFFYLFKTKYENMYMWNRNYFWRNWKWI